MMMIIIIINNAEKIGPAGQVTDENVIQCIHIARWVTKATETLIICNNYCFNGNNGYAYAPQCYV